MCTCMTYQREDFYFGRNMDLEVSFGEKVVVTPRNYPLLFRRLPEQKHHYAMIGMASVAVEYPLYAEAVNERGLAAAGLHFPGNAVYRKICPGKKNVAPYELIPWTLGQCASVKEACELLEDINLLKEPFQESLPLVPLHFMIADSEACVVLESVEDGVHIYKNAYGVLTNNPPFPYYQAHLGTYRNLTAEVPANQFSRKLELTAYGQGLGGVGLPGDFSPVSRFVKAAFLKWNSREENNECSVLSQVFHILDAVAMVRGAVLTEDGKADITRYSCCVNAAKGIYYYKTYENSQIRAVDLKKEDLAGKTLRIFDPEVQGGVVYQND